MHDSIFPFAMENVGDSPELMHKLETIVSLVKELKNGLKRKLEGNFKSLKKNPVVPSQGSNKGWQLPRRGRWRLEMLFPVSLSRGCDQPCDGQADAW